MGNVFLYRNLNVKDHTLLVMMTKPFTHFKVQILISFINLKGVTDPQIKSRRVPRTIHKLAESIFPYMSQSLEKNWKPRDAEGEVEYHT